MRIGVYGGSFDPITLGHLDVISKGSLLFDKLYVVICDNANKKHQFALITRKWMIAECIGQYPNVASASSTCSLLVETATSLGASFLLRGLRNESDFQYELQMSAVNKVLAPKLNTIFVMADQKFNHVSSSVVRELWDKSGDLSWAIPEQIENWRRHKYDAK